MPDPQKTLQWWAENPARLASAGSESFWQAEGVAPEDAGAIASWGMQTLAPLSRVSDPEVRKNMLYQRLVEAQEKDPTSKFFLEAYGGDTGAFSRFTSGLKRGAVEGVGGAALAEALGVDRGYNSGAFFDANNLGNIAGNMLGFAVPGGAAAKLGTRVIPKVIGFGLHGLSQGLGGHDMFERDKQGTRELAQTLGAEVPPSAQASPRTSLPAVLNTLGQAGLSAASGGFGAKVNQLMRQQQAIPASLARASVASPLVEGGTSGLLQLNDATSGHPFDTEGVSLMSALGAPAGMGLIGSGMTYRGLRGYVPPQQPAPVTGHPSTARPQVGMPAAAGELLQGVQRTRTPQPSVLADRDTARAVMAAVQGGDIDANLTWLTEAMRAGEMKAPGGGSFFARNPGQQIDADLMSILAPDASQGMGRYMARQGQEVLGIPESHIRDQARGWELGVNLGGMEHSVPGSEYQPMPSHMRVTAMINGQPQEVTPLFKTIGGEGGSWIVAVDTGQGWQAHKLPAEMIQQGENPNPRTPLGKPKHFTQPEMRRVALGDQVRHQGNLAAIEQALGLSAPVASHQQAPRPVVSHQQGPAQQRFLDDDITNFLDRIQTQDLRLRR